MLALSKAFALAGATDEARAIRDEVGSFPAVRSALVKAQDKGRPAGAERGFAIAQLVNRTVVSTNIVDILQAAGLQKPDISILSDEFLSAVQETKQPNLALQALQKLLNDEIRSRSWSNAVETKKFSERLEAAIACYHTSTP